MTPRQAQRFNDARRHAVMALEILERYGEQTGTDNIARLALERSAEIVGEVFRVLVEHDPAIAHTYPNLPWREAVGLRTKLAHGYDKIEPALLIDAVREHFPGLIAEIDRVLEAGS